MRNLPSTTWVVAVAMPLAALALISAFFYFMHRQELATDEPDEQLAIAEQNLAVMETLTAQDTDKDGLKDWEETLWRSDPKKSDTDGDGTNDGREVELDRNPVVAGPNDDAHEIAFSKSIVSSSSASTSLTDIAAQEMYTGYMLLKQSNSLNAQSVQGLVSSVLEGSGYQPQTKKYTLADLRVNETNDPSVLLSYRDTIFEMTNTLNAYPESEFTILQRMFTAPSKEDRDSLLTLSQAYAAAAKSMSEVEVPIAIQSPHLTILNNLEQRSEMIVRLATFSTDPLASMLELQSVAPSLNANIAASTEIMNYLTSQGV